MIPSAKKTLKISRTGLAIISAALLLASLLATMTISNINREERLMQNFLLHEGLTLIRAFEAGARTTMMHRMQGDSPLATLVAETVKEPSVIYIRVLTGSGREIAAAGILPLEGQSPSVAMVSAAKKPITTLFSGDDAVFEVAASFTPVKRNSSMNMMMGNWQSRWGRMAGNSSNDLPKIIYLGLATSEFKKASRTDVIHAMLLGAILFLAGVAGLYLIFANQGRKVAENTLIDMELYTKNVIESMPAGLITLDNKGRVVSCNSKAEEFTGRSLTSLVGKKLPDEMPSCPEITIDSPQLLDKPIDCRHGDEIIPVKISSSKLIGVGGAITGLVLIIRDVREIQEMEEKLERSRRLASLGRMAAGIAHEIRNPLGTLRGFAQLFKGKFAGQETEQGYAALMIEEIDRLNRTISGMLQFAKPREAEFKKLAITELLDKAVKLLSEDCKSNGIVLTFVPPSPEIILNADPDLLLQVVINLLKNSIEALKHGGTIEIFAEHGAENSIVVKIEDSGKGMSAGEQARMFDPFYTTRKSGTGLGLAIVHQIMTQHHGSLEVRSKTGTGTTISLIFPS